jgi:hypothetical protein
MSWTTGTQTEALSANNAVGTSFASFTTAQYVGPSASGAGYLPANFFLPALGGGKSLLVKAFGVLGTTTTPNVTVGLSGNITQGIYSGGTPNIFATTTAIAGPASGSNMPWELDVIITCVTTGSAGTFLADGALKLYPTTTTVQNFRCSSSAANPNTVTSAISTESAMYLEPFAAFSASSASNNIQVYNIAILGLN